MSTERGTTTVIAVVATLVLGVGAVGAADVGLMVIARARAAAAADAAALAAAATIAPVLGRGEDPREAARAAAEANDARLDACACDPGGTEASVEVSVPVRTLLIGAWDGRRVRGAARASVAFWIYSYRDDDGPPAG